MCRGDLSTPHSVYELQPSDRAALIVCAQYDPAKNAIAQNSRYSKADAISLLLEYERRLRFFVKLRQPHIRVNAGQQRRAFRKAQFKYSIEIVGRDWPHRRLGAPRNSPPFIQNTALNRPGRSVESDWIGKIEITSRFDQSEVHT